MGAMSTSIPVMLSVWTTSARMNATAGSCARTVQCRENHAAMIEQMSLQARTEES